MNIDLSDDELKHLIKTLIFHMKLMDLDNYSDICKAENELNMDKKISDKFIDKLAEKRLEK